ncbi:pneumococcal serine-rich repeat protein isoform X2 [Anopheles stephensi]|uniref:pneumococcal serine-rich repeat protein isoform X2 n=1 Tax=Anopheles stephensi TaxID=30069 RepID=UPI0016589CA5|nr:pneumococcal serine-rich repeat protein isoform X2 [Anopheles stephensi]
MSTLTNNANNSNNNNNNNNIIINNNGSGSNSASIQQQQQQHHQFSPQGSTPPTSTSGAVGTAYSTTSNSFNNNFHASDCINIINNNLSSSSSNTTANQSHPTATTTSTTASSSTSSGGVVSGILGVQEFSAKLFLPFSRSKMMHSTSINATTDSSGTMDGTMAGAGPSSKGAAGNAFTGASSTGSGTGRSGGGSTLVIPEVLNVVLHGYQRKLKTNKKKYFVVYGDRPGKPARLEYFDSEKKFKQSFMKGGGCEGPSAKRSISLRSCFNINKRHDSKKHIIALFTKDDCFCIVFESENEMTRWLRILLRLQRGEESEGDPPRPTFEHVWDVYVQRKGLGDSYGILGTYRLCITDKTLSLVRIGPEFTPQQEKRAANVDFSLASIRRCGHSQRYFYLEVGRSTKTGAGEIWMEVQDSIIAQNMYTTIMKSAKSKDDNLGPMIRIRSSSANAASKPTSMLFRRQTHTGQKPINCSPSSEDQSNNAQNSESSSSAASINTVVLVGSPPKGTASSGAPNSKPRPVVVANPNLPVCAENSLLGSCATSAANSATAPSATTATFGTACTSVATTITSVTTVTSSVATASMASSAMYPTTPDASYQHAPTIVPFAGHASASAAAACSTFTPGAMFTCSHSSNSSLTSIGSCSPIDAYVPLLPGAGRSTSPNQHPLSCAAVATGGGAAGAVGSGATVSGRGGLVGSPRLGVTAQSPSYRRTSLKKPVSENCPSRTAKMEASPVLSSTPRGGQQSRHYHQQQQHLHGTTASMLPPAASHLSHHHTLAQHPHHHHHPYLHPGTQAPLTSAVVATGAVVGHPATPNSVAGLLHAATGVVGTSSCSSSRSNSSSSSNSTSTIAVTNEFSSSSTDHVTSASSTAGVFHQRALSLPSAPMLGHSPHSNTNHLGTLHATGSSVRSSSQSSVAAPPASGTGQGPPGPALPASLSSSSASSTGTIQPVHHRTRSLPLTEESAIRVTSYERSGQGSGWWHHNHNHHHTNPLQYSQHHYSSSLSSTTGANHRKSSSAYLLAPTHVCSLHGGTASSTPNGGGGWSPPVSDAVLCTSPHRHQYEFAQDGTTGTPFASLVPSRSSMESIIEDQRYLPMDLKKPSPEESDSGQTSGQQLPLISRLLRSTNLQQQPSASASSPAPLSAGKMGLLGLKMAMMGGGGGGASAGSVPTGTGHPANGGCSCSSPSSQCSSSSNCNHAISSNTTSHKSTNGSSPAALRRPIGGRTASGTISRSVAIARERCDSLPSRNRTTSETMPHQQQQQQQQQQQLQQQQQYQQHHQQLQHHQLMLNSGGMPPPRMIPSSNRPHSVHISHSHSPPVNSSPLSPPPPATYSTGSDGSSLSIDESTDSFITGSLTPDEGNGYPKVINQLNSGCSIPEENSEEFIKDYGHIDLRAGCGFSQHDDFAVPAARRGGSPAPPSTVGSVEGSAYMEMCSPSGSSPGDPSGSCYMAMSPVADFSRGLCSSSSAHSRASSLAEDMVDGSGYVPMSMPRAVPPAEEYVLMDPTLNGGAGSRLSSATSGGGTGNNGGGGSGMGGGGMSSAASSCSITSGTPSTDLRLSLEKVPAYIGQSDDHEVNDRPFRTYSVGSRPELIKRKLRVEMLSSGDSSVGGSAGGSASSRQRAFSVGSRAKVPRCSDVYKGYSAAPVIVSFASTSSQGSMLESSNNNSSSSTSSISHAGSFGASIGDTLPMDELGAIGRKSGSGSLLPDGNGKPPSHGSHGRMSDLMEIDYSSPRQVKPSTRTSEPAGMEDYLDMSGNGNNNEEDRRAGAPSATSGYVEMRPGRVNSQCEENDYLNMTPGSIAASSRVGIDEPDCPVGGSGSAKPTSSPIQINSAGPTSTDTATSGSSAGQNNNYLEMYPRALAKDTNRGSAAATKVPSEDYLNMAPLMISSLGDASGSEEKMATHQQHGGGGEDESLESSSAPDGYMEMSWNHGVVTTGSSSSSSNNRAERNVPTNGDDYMNMSCGPPPPSQSEDAFRAYSAPITIQPSAGKCRLDLSGESKVEAGANIPNYLPLGQHPDARKSVHHHHHPHAPPATIVALQQHLPLSAQAPIQTTTGQQSGSIGFSPASKPVTETPERARCDSRDSGIVTPSGSQPTIFPFSPASPTKPFAPGQAQQDEPMVESLENLSQNYAELSLGRQQLQQQQQQQQQHQGDPSPATRKLSAGSRGSVSFSKLQLLSTGSFSQPDYVNFCPTTPPVEGMNVPLNVQPSRTRIEDDGAGDYALMNPASSRKLSTTSMGAAAGGTAGTHTSPLAPSSLGSSSSSADGVSPPVLVARKSTLLLSSPQMGFKPITSSQDAELLLHSKLPMPSANSPKALNLARRSGEPAFNFNTEQQLPPLQRSISTGTRPNSVNSELIGKGCGATTPGPNTGSTTTIPGSAASTRPSSANSERLPIISATSSSASSTSTLCESKNQSPSASSTALTATTATTTSPSVPGSRPDSVSSITDPNIVSRPPSVSSERELHYASLDLPPCSKQTPVASPFSAGTMMLLSGGGGGASGINIAGGGSSSSSAVGGVTKMDVDEPLPGANESRSSIDSITSSSPSPSSSGCNLHQQQQQQQQPVRCAAFTYAKIDFVRSQAQKQHQPAGGSGPAGSTGSGSTSTPQSSQA